MPYDSVDTRGKEGHMQEVHQSLVPPAVQEMMVAYDKKVIHYDVADTYGRG